MLKGLPRHFCAVQGRLDDLTKMSESVESHEGKNQRVGHCFFNLSTSFFNLLDPNPGPTRREFLPSSSHISILEMRHDSRIQPFGLTLFTPRKEKDDKIIETNLAYENLSSILPSSLPLPFSSHSHHHIRDTSSTQ